MIKNINTPHVKYSNRFNQRLNETTDEIKEAVAEAIELLVENQNHPALRNHALVDEYVGFQSIDVTSDYRALYRREGNVVIFVYLGTHEELYGS